MFPTFDAILTKSSSHEIASRLHGIGNGEKAALEKVVKVKLIYTVTDHRQKMSNFDHGR